MIRKTTQTIRLAPIFMIIIFMVSACAQINSLPNEKNIENSMPANQPDSPHEKVQTTPELDPVEEDIEGSIEKAQEDSHSEQSNPDESETIQIKYRIAANYDIRPIEEETDDRIVLLTFDDGPKNETLINQMLDVLDENEAKAIFFVNGYRVKQNPHLLVHIYERGHIIGNHAWDHINLKSLDEEAIDEQINTVQQLVEELTGEKPRFFRPPFGASNDYVKEKIKAEKMAFMNWSNGSEDWEKANQYPEGVIERVMEQLRPGSNILMHELPWTVEALDSLLQLIQEEGYNFVHPLAIQIEDEA